MSNAESTRIITPTARLSFPALFKPARPMAEGADEKYQCELIFEKGANLAPLKEAIKTAIKNKWGDKPPKNLRIPLRDGDTDREGKDGYEGCMFISARSKDRPGVVIGPHRDICTPDREHEVYGGCYVRASITAFAYDTAGNKGVAWALNNVWKLRDGEPFGGRRNAQEEFGDVEVDQEAFGELDDDVVSSLL
jgi:hypothetical protein